MKNINRNRTIALGTLAVVGAATFGGVGAKPAEANSKTWKNVAIGAGIVTGYGLLSGKKDVAVLGGIATAGSYLKYKDEKKDEDRRDDWRYDRNRRDDRYDRNNRYGNYNYNDGRGYRR